MMHHLGQKDLARFAAELRGAERSPATIEKYSRALVAFRRWLPADKGVDKERVIAYKALLGERYAPASVNAALAGRPAGLFPVHGLGGLRRAAAEDPAAGLRPA